MAKLKLPPAVRDEINWYLGAAPHAPSESELPAYLLANSDQAAVNRIFSLLTGALFWNANPNASVMLGTALERLGPLRTEIDVVLWRELETALEAQWLSRNAQNAQGPLSPCRAIMLLVKINPDRAFNLSLDTLKSTVRLLAMFSEEHFDRIREGASRAAPNRELRAILESQSLRMELAYGVLRSLADDFTFWQRRQVIDGLKEVADFFRCPGYEYSLPSALVRILGVVAGQEAAPIFGEMLRRMRMNIEVFQAEFERPPKNLPITDANNLEVICTYVRGLTPEERSSPEFQPLAEQLRFFAGLKLLGKSVASLI